MKENGKKLLSLCPLRAHVFARVYARSRVGVFMALWKQTAVQREGKKVAHMLLKHRNNNNNNNQMVFMNETLNETLKRGEVMTTHRGNWEQIECLKCDSYKDICRSKLYLGI